MATSKTLAQVGTSGCERTQAVVTRTSTPPTDERIRRNIGFSTWGRIMIEIAQGEPQHDVGTERNEKDGVRDLPHSLNPYPHLTRFRREESSREANAHDGVENNPSSTRDERRREEDSE